MPHARCCIEHTVVLFHKQRHMAHTDMYSFDLFRSFNFAANVIASICTVFLYILCLITTLRIRVVKINSVFSVNKEQTLQKHRK